MGKVISHYDTDSVRDFDSAIAELHITDHDLNNYKVEASLQQDGTGPVTLRVERIQEVGPRILLLETILK